MNIKSLKFKSFRNLSELQIELCDRVNVFCGENAQGKTNIIEGVSVLSGEKSFRTSKDRELIEVGCEKAVVEAVFNSGNRDNEMSLEIENGRRVTLNGLLEEKEVLSDRFFCVVFSPSHLSLVKEGPEKRRKFLDSCICRISPKYTKYIADYEHVLYQRNNLIRELKYSRNADDRIENELAVWDISLANLGCVIHNMRKKYLQRLSEKAAVFYDGISSGTESLTLNYISTVFDTDIEDKNFQRDVFYNKLRAGIDEDIKNGFTGCGIQRDDFCMNVDGKNARLYGSQGQQRSCVLSIKMGECEIVADAFGEKPVVLLDDVMSELDRKRQNFIMNCLEGMQVFITCCEVNDLKNFKEGKIFTVKDGKILRQRYKKPRKIK